MNTNRDHHSIICQVSSTIYSQLLSSVFMYRYFIKTPWWVRRFFHRYRWRIATTEQEVFLTFDDGPHPTITPWVLQQLAAYGAKATFFCIGQNVARYPEVYAQIIAAGHSVGNHTNRHLNGWKTSTPTYLQDVADASALIKSNLFRPPYGRIRATQAKGIAHAINQPQAEVIMWDVLSADFDQNISPQQCAANVLRHSLAGSIIVFHDSEKAVVNLKGSLPLVLKKLQQRGYRFSRLKQTGYK